MSYRIVSTKSVVRDVRYVISHAEKNGHSDGTKDMDNRDWSSVHREFEKGMMDRKAKHKTTKHKENRRTRAP